MLTVVTLFGFLAVAEQIVAAEPQKSPDDVQKQPGQPQDKRSLVSKANGPNSTLPQTSPPDAADWPVGSRVSGRVIDHRGAPVVGAEVLLLGDERIFVAADRRTWFVLPTEKGRPPAPPSTRTTIKGEFLIQREKGAGNRLAVISDSPLLWVVSRKSLPQADNVEIKLPSPGSLAIHCDLPGKAATQPVMIELRSFDGTNWNADVLRFHCVSFSVTNPGETVFEDLPRGRYAVQRNQEIQTGERETLMTLADRQLADVASDKPATVRFERKVGRPLAGTVRGLENVDLRHAHVTINYFGPEEEPGPNGKRIRYGTAFDVIPITSEGRFATDPIPPGKYWVDLFALRTSTPKESPQQSDFSGQLQFTVPETGEMPKVEIVVKARAER